MNPFKAASAVFLAALLAVAPLLWAETFTSRVVAEEDGDTFWVVREGKREKIRIHGIDAPEMDRPYGEAAKKFAAKLAFGKVVTVNWESRGSYGRIIGRLQLPDGGSFGLRMVRAGMAWWYRQYARERTNLADAEAEARKAKWGLWANPKPVPPWEHRRQRK